MSFNSKKIVYEYCFKLHCFLFFLHGIKSFFYHGETLDLVGALLSDFLRNGASSNYVDSSFIFK